MRGSRWPTLTGAALAAAGALSEMVASLSGSVASGQDHWPGPLDWLRQYSWPAVGGAALVAVLLGARALREPDAAGRGSAALPPSVPPIPQWVVDREQAGEVAAVLCGRGGRRAVGITATAQLHGAGGFGKTTLAEMVWAHKRVQRRFGGRVYRIVLGRDVRSRAQIAAKVAEATRFITGDGTDFDDPDLAGAHLGRLLDAGPDALLILDDVWHADQLAPFMIGSNRCRRLITTRLPELLSVDAHRVLVDEMSPAQAEQVLAFGLPSPLPRQTLEGLLRATGRWPLLLRLANGQILQRLRTGDGLPRAGSAVLERLRRRGPAGLDPEQAVDLNDQRERQATVRAAVEASTELLPPGGPDRFAELAVFAEDETVPVPLVIALWETTACLSEEASRRLCTSLADQSLLFLTPDDGGRVRLHDVIRDYLRTQLPDERLRHLHHVLIDAAAQDVPAAEPQPGGGAGPGLAWWQIPDGYLADHLIAHLVAAGRAAEAETLASDLRWVERRLAQRGATAPVADLSLIPTPACRRAAAELVRHAHLLIPTAPVHAQAAVLRSRLAESGAWHTQATAWRAPHPALYNRWSLPDLPHPAYRRALTDENYQVNAVAVAPDGTWLATGGEDRTVRIWDMATGTLTRALTGNPGLVGAVAISPDGAWLATAPRVLSGRVQIWDAATGTPTSRLPGRLSMVRSVAVSPDGTWLATIASLSRKVRIRSVATGAVTRTLVSHLGRMRAVAISPDGTWLATGGAGGAVHIWETSGPARVLTGHTGAVNAVAISPDGTWLATGGDDRTVRIWDAATGALTRALTGHVGAVRTVAVSPDGTWLATGGEERAVHIWDTGEDPTPQSGASRGSGLISVAASPDGTWLATASRDAPVQVWDAVTGTLSRTLADHSRSSKAVAISPDGTWLATADKHGTVRIWDAATGTPTRTFTADVEKVNGVTISPDGTRVATSGHGHSVRIWDVATGRTVRIPLRPGRLHALYAPFAHAVVFSPDGTWLATCGYGAVRIWDAATGRAVHRLTGHVGAVRAVAVSPDGTMLAIARSEAAFVLREAEEDDAAGEAPVGEYPVRIWDVATGADRILTGHTAEVNAVVFSPDGTWLATAGEDRTVRVWSTVTGTPVAMMPATAPLTSCGFLPDGRGLIVAGAHGLYAYDFDPG